MLDLAGIMFSSVIMVMAVLRAVQLDRTLPWFEKVNANEVSVATNKRPWQRRT